MSGTRSAVELKYVNKKTWFIISISHVAAAFLKYFWEKSLLIVVQFETSFHKLHGGKFATTFFYFFPIKLCSLWSISKIKRCSLIKIPINLFHFKARRRKSWERAFKYQKSIQNCSFNNSRNWKLFTKRQISSFPSAFERIQLWEEKNIWSMQECHTKKHKKGH